MRVHIYGNNKWSSWDYKDVTELEYSTEGSFIRFRFRDSSGENIIRGLCTSILIEDVDDMSMENRR